MDTKEFIKEFKTGKWESPFGHKIAMEIIAPHGRLTIYKSESETDLFLDKKCEVIKSFMGK